MLRVANNTSSALIHIDWRDTVGREPWSPKQKLLIVITLFCLNTPAIIFVFFYSSNFTPRQVSLVGRDRQ